MALRTGELGHKAEVNREGQHSTVARTTHNQNSEGKADPICSLTTIPGQVLLENEVPKNHNVWTCNVRWKQQRAETIWVVLLTCHTATMWNAGVMARQVWDQPRHSPAQTC